MTDTYLWVLALFVYTWLLASSTTPPAEAWSHPTHTHKRAERRKDREGEGEGEGERMNRKKWNEELFWILGWCWVRGWGWFMRRGVWRDWRACVGRYRYDGWVYILAKQPTKTKDTCYKYRNDKKTRACLWIDIKILWVDWMTQHTHTHSSPASATFYRIQRKKQRERENRQFKLDYM